MNMRYGIGGELAQGTSMSMDFPKSRVHYSRLSSSSQRVRKRHESSPQRKTTTERAGLATRVGRVGGVLRT